MSELLTAEQMRALEGAAIDSGQATGLELMERAGRGVVEAILDWRPALAAAPHRALVLCGPGNNGGDGFVVARLLADRGWEVAVLLYGRDPDALDKLPPDAAENARRWRERGDIAALTAAAGPAAPADLVIDALFGTGLTRPLGDDLLEATARLFPEGFPRDRAVAIDAPSGLCMDSGRPLGGALAAALTVTFHARRLGQVLAEGPGRCGTVRVKPIGLPETAAAAPDAAAVAHEARPAAAALAKAPGDHKYRHGHALVLAGGAAKGGAARLAARGALRAGAGLVTVCAPAEALAENAARLDAIMLRAVEDADALSETLADERLNAVCLGPGLGVGPRTLALVAAALGARRGTVLDADALTSFADDPAKLFALLHPDCVLTPHLGEFARVFPDIADRLKAPPEGGPAYSRVDAARAAAERAGCTVLLKGPDTVIADPPGRAVVNAAHGARAAPWLATAGAGDVLSGMIAGLLARGFEPLAAAETAAWLHVEAARTFGPGLVAEDLPEMLPAVFRDLGL